jgi:competence protein ComEC
MGPEGRSLSAPRGQGFAAKNWLENDGDLADQKAAAARPGFNGPNAARGFALGPGLGAVVLKGKDAATAAGAACASHALVVLAAQAPDEVAGACLMIDQGFLRQTGPLALWPRGDGALHLEPTHKAARLWSPGLPVAAERLVWWPAPAQLVWDQ